MTALEMGTRAAIWTLIGGSLAVFVWFARDLVRLVRSVAAEGNAGAARRSDVEPPSSGREGPALADDPPQPEEP